MRDPKPKLVTFDVYSALLDIETSLTALLAARLGLAEAPARAMAKDWRGRQMARAAASNALGRGRTPFRTATRLGLDAVLAQRGQDLAEAERQELVRAWDDLDPWPEAQGVLAEIRSRGFATAILSNGDQDMLDVVAGLFDPGFDHVLSSETAGWYKPHPSVYALPEEILRVAATDVLHVAGGAIDVLGAVSAGMPCFWSNRRGEPPLDPAYPADYEAADLTGVLGLLCDDGRAS